jgi:hypothetical protein
MLTMSRSATPALGSHTQLCQGGRGTSPLVKKMAKKLLDVCSIMELARQPMGGASQEAANGFL